MSESKPRQFRHAVSGAALTALLLLITQACASARRGEPVADSGGAEIRQIEGACDESPAPPTAVSYRSPKLEKMPGIDGFLGAVEWGTATWTDELRAADEGPEGASPVLRSRARFAWDAHNLYVAVACQEPSIEAAARTHDGDVEADDHILLMIDPGGDTHDYLVIAVNSRGVTSDVRYDRPPRDGGAADREFDVTGLQVAASMTGTLNDPSDEDRGWSVEIAVPWTVLGELGARRAPRFGDRLQIEVARKRRQRPDESAPATSDRMHLWTWSSGDGSLHRPERWGTLEFAGPGLGSAAPVTIRGSDRARSALRLVYFREHCHFKEHGEFTTDFAALGIEMPPLEGFDWPPEISVADGFTVTLTRPDGRAMRLRSDGHVDWVQLDE